MSILLTNVTLKQFSLIVSLSIRSFNTTRFEKQGEKTQPPTWISITGLKCYPHQIFQTYVLITDKSIALNIRTKNLQSSYKAAAKNKTWKKYLFHSYSIQPISRLKFQLRSNLSNGETSPASTAPLATRQRGGAGCGGFGTKGRHRRPRFESRTG